MFALAFLALEKSEERDLIYTSLRLFIECVIWRHSGGLVVFKEFLFFRFSILRLILWNPIMLIQLTENIVRMFCNILKTLEHKRYLFIHRMFFHETF